MPTVMHEGGAATRYPRGMKGVSTARTSPLEDQISTLSSCYSSYLGFCSSKHRVSTFPSEVIVLTQALDRDMIKDPR